MFNPKKECEDKIEILAYLELLLDSVTSLQASVNTVMADIAAMRDTVLSDAEDMAAYKINRKAASVKPVVDEALRSYHDLINEIAGRQQYKN